MYSSAPGTKRVESVSSIRNKTHKDYADIKVCNPITLGLISEGVLKEEVNKAQKKAQKSK
jgi:hypothetical protein